MCLLIRPFLEEKLDWKLKGLMGGVDVAAVHEPGHQSDELSVHVEQGDEGLFGE
jgi:hypothetical protein